MKLERFGFDNKEFSGSKFLSFDECTQDVWLDVQRKKRIVKNEESRWQMAMDRK